ncbi:MAG: cytochrome b/b6 domain-containing protein [Pseudomonadota bacterium]|nr:cytochrome b/b6 domain-containing protein [Pseudomonadota bacterium]
MNPATYDRTTIRFHWTTAALVVALWLIGQTADWFPRGPLRGAAWSAHFTLGALLALAYLGRIAWRITAGRRLPGLGSPALVKFAAAGHGIIYLGIAIVIAIGVANLYAKGASVWGLIEFPKIADKSLRATISGAHEWAANLLLLLAGGHAALALLHQYVWRDGALTRMWPSLARD